MRKFRFWLLTITLLGLLPRVMLLITRGSFWFDEVFTLELARLPFWEMLRLASADTNPPLWTILMWPWVHLFPHTEWIVRIPALVLGTLTVPLVGLLGKRIASERVGLIAAVIIALSPTLIYFSTEARMYALFVFLSVLAGYLLTKRGYTLAAFLLLFTHTYAILPVIGFYVWGLIELPKTNYKKWHITHAILFGAWGAWVLWSYVPKLHDLFSNSWFMRVTPPFGWPFTPLFETVVLRGTIPSFIFISVAVLVLGSIVFGMIKIVREKHLPLFGLVITMIIGIAVAGFFGPARLKYFLFILPMASITIAWSLTVMPKKMGIILSTIIFVIATSSTTFFIRDFRFSWDRAATFASTQSETDILIPWAVNSLPFSHYSEQKLIVIPPPGTEKTDIKTLLVHNWKWEMKPDYTMARLEKLVPEKGNLLIVQSDPYVYGVQEWLAAHGWKFIETRTFDTMQSVKIERYTK